MTGGGDRISLGKWIKQRFRKVRNWIKLAPRDARYAYMRFIRNNRFALIRLRQVIACLVGIAVCVFGVIAILHANALLSLDIPVKELVVAQVAVASITISIVALIASFSERTVFGLPLSEVVFKNIFFSAAILLFPFILTALNLVLLIARELFSQWIDVDVAILCIFYLTYLLVFLVVTKIASAVVFPRIASGDAQLLYYKANVRQMRRDRPLWDASDKLLLRLQDVTFKYIAEGNILLNENMRGEAEVAEALLWRRRKLYQNYLMEYSHYNDPLSHIASYCEELLFRKRLIEGIKNLHSAFRMLNTYEVINVSNQLMWSPLDRAASAARYVEDVEAALVYQTELYGVEQELWLQRDLFLRTDFSGYRLNDAGIMHAPYIPDDMLARYYFALADNAYLSEGDKDRLVDGLFDLVRMSFVGSFSPICRRVASDYRVKQRHSADYMKRDFKNRSITVRSLAVLMMAVAEKGNEGHFKLFTKANMDDAYYCALWIQCLAALVNHLLDGCKSQYVYGLKLRKTETEKYIRYIAVERMASNASLVHELYTEILVCLTKSPDGPKRETQLWWGNPRLSFEVGVLQGVVKYLALRSGSLEGESLGHSIPASVRGELAFGCLCRLHGPQ